MGGYIFSYSSTSKPFNSEHWDLNISRTCYCSVYDSLLIIYIFIVHHHFILHRPYLQQNLHIFRYLLSGVGPSRFSFSGCSRPVAQAVCAMSKRGWLQEFSILDTFKRCKTFAKRLTREQHLTLQYHGTHPSLVAWPLGFPWWEYIKKANLMRVNIQDLAEDGLDSDDEWMQPGSGQAAAGQVPQRTPLASPFGLTPPLPRGVPNFGTMWPWDNMSQKKTPKWCSKKMSQKMLPAILFDPTWSNSNATHFEILAFRAVGLKWVACSWDSSAMGKVMALDCRA